MSRFVKVATLAEIPPGQGKVVSVEGLDVALFNASGTVHAIDNACKHRGGALGEGELDGTIVTCPLHGWTYDVSSGECFDDPDGNVACFPIKLEGDDVLVEIP